ncbi:MAG: helix-turn-helix transcriptional regulator [Butyrivibrio sp.]|nr:helix-turn-helix transcriptional regulator [Butyrivibrio sp.]
MYIGKNIRYLRKLHNLSQDDLAARFGYKSYTTIQKWETGTSEPPIGVVDELAKMFRVDIDAFVKSDFELPAASNEQDTPNETELLRIFRRLNEDGQKDLLKYARMSEVSGIYLANGSDLSGSGDISDDKESEDGIA